MQFSIKSKYMYIFLIFFSARQTQSLGSIPLMRDICVHLCYFEKHNFSSEFDVT